MSRILPSALLCLGTFLTAPVLAQIYSYTDASGQRVFSDQPPSAATPHSSVELKPVNRMPAGQRMIKLKAPAELKQQLAPPPPPYTSLALLSPVPGDTLSNSGRSIVIQVSSSPALLSGHHYQAWLDGAAYGPASETDSWRIDEVNRGEHQLQVQLLDEQGNSLMQTEVATLYVRQTTLADRKRVNPCKDDDYGKRPECPLAEKPEKTKPWWRMGL